MSDKHTPWSGSRRRPGVRADQFGSLDPGVIRAATSRGRPRHPAPSAWPESESAETESEDEDPPSSGSAARAVSAPEPGNPRRAYDSGTHTAEPPAPWPAESADLYEYLPHADTAGALPIGGQALIGLCLGLAVLLAVSCFYLNPTVVDDPAAAPATLVTAVSTRATTEEAPPEEPSPDIGVGFVFGKVKSNDGSTLHVSSELTKSEVVVHTDAETRVYVLIATEVAAIAVGAPVLVYGRKHADGSVSADTITGISLRAIGSN